MARDQGDPVPIDSILLLIEWYRDAIDHNDYTDMYGDGETEIDKIKKWIDSRESEGE